MAWNEPGGNKGRDPWGNRPSGGGDQGPPDLDELFKKAQEKFGGLFGSGGQGGRSPLGLNLGLIVVILALIWAATGFYIIEPAERGVVLRFGKYHTTVLPGLHWQMRIVDTVYRVDVDEVRSISRPSLILTQDENVVDVDLEVQYRIKEVENYVLRMRDPEGSIKQVADSALRQVIGRSTLESVQTLGREQVAQDTKDKMQELLDRYSTGLLVTQVNMQQAEPPEEVKPAFDDVIKAREDQVRSQNEAEAYANEIVPIARGKAQRVLEEAEAYKQRVIAQSEGETQRFLQLLVEYEKAPEVTRNRLYLETMEQVLGRSSKVMVDVEGGNNLLYLPLDKLVGGSQAGRNFEADSSGLEPKRSSSTRGVSTDESAGRDSDRFRDRFR